MSGGPRQGEPGPAARAFVAWTLRWGRWLWAVALLLAVPAVARTASLYIHLRSDFEQLLPRSAPSVLAIDELRARLPGLQHLGVLVDCGSAQNLPAAERFLDDLAARVSAYPRDLVGAVRTGDGVERRFIEDHAPLYIDASDLEEVQRRIEARRDWEASKAQGALLDEDEPPPPLVFDDIQRKYDHRTSSSKRFDNDHFASAEQHTSLLLIELSGFESGRSRGGELLRRVRKDIAALDPDTYAPGMKLGFTSDVAINVEETQALVSDLSVSSVMVIVLVVGVIVAYYQWWRSVVVLLPPLLLAAAFAFAFASLPPLSITELNSNTAFLGSIIVGNGINFGIVLLARYVEERRRGVAVEEALAYGVWGARTGTLAAALAAGVSYASLRAPPTSAGSVSSCVIGGVGMVLSWGLAFLLMPPLARWVEIVVRLCRSGSGTSRWCTWWTSCSVGAGGSWRSASSSPPAARRGKVRSFGNDQIETDFSKLRRADTWTSGEGYWGRKMDALLGSYVTPTVILANDPAQARAIGRVLRDERDNGGPLASYAANVRTLDDVVPADQERKIAIANDIRDDLTPKIRQSLTDEQRRAVDRLLGNGPLHTIGPSDLPATFTAGLRERDGTIGRTVLVYPKPSHLLWEGPPLADFVGRLRAAAATPVPGSDRPARVAGSLPLSADILDSVRRDGVTASAAALAGVVVVVVLLLRASPATGLVLGSLLLGVLWLAGGMMALGVKINFANFIAYPITFGIGGDYSVNMASRWDLDGRRSMAHAIRTTGGAVTLCSLTTIIGYSSLLVAQNRALYLFGLLAVMGEIACLSTAVIFLPAFVEWALSLRAAARARKEEST